MKTLLTILVLSAELIQFTKQHFQATFKPGTDYHYTDTEYILLGLIIEQLEGKPLHQVFAERIFQPLNMTLSSMHLRSEPMASPNYPMAELYAEVYKISGLSYWLSKPPYCPAVTIQLIQLCRPGPKC